MTIQRASQMNSIAERPRIEISMMKAGLERDYQKWMYLIFIVLGGMIFWAFVAGSAHHGLN